MEDRKDDARLEHERALNRERARRFRARRRNGRTGVIVDDNGKPNSSLARIALNLAKGMNDSQALIQAGSSRKATCLIDKAKQGLAEILKAKGLTPAVVVDSTMERVQATSPMLTSEGTIERPDWSARSAGCRDAIALLDRAGELPALQPGPGGTQITVQILQFGSVTPPDVVNEAIDCNPRNPAIDDNSNDYKALEP